MALLDNVTAFYKCEEATGATTIADATLRGNDLTTYLRPGTSTEDFTLAANASGGQTLTGRLAGWGKWDRLLTTGEKAAIAAGEKWPFSTTTTLQDAKVYYLLNEASSATTFADATGRGNTLTKTGSATTQVVGPGGSGNGCQFNGSTKLSRAITADLQAGNVDHTVCGWVYLDTTGSGQSILWSQINLSTGNVGDAVYYHQANNRFQVDWGGGDADTSGIFRNNAVAVATTFGAVSTGVWRLVIAEFDAAGNQLSISVNNGTKDTLTQIQQPAQTTGKIGNGLRFGPNPLYSTTNGWDAVGGLRADRATTNDLKFGNNAKTVWGWVKFANTSTTQSLLGFYDSTSGNKIDWIVQQSAGRLYFLMGNSVNTFWFTSVPLTDTSGWHLFVAWFDKDGDGKIHLNLDNGAQVGTPTTPTATPASSAIDFVMGARRNNTNSFNEPCNCILDAIGIANGVPSAGDLTALWNSGNGIEYTPDTTAPVVTSAAINTDGTALVLTYTETGSPPMLPATGVTGYTLSSTGAAVTVSSGAISSTTVTLALSRTVYNNETLTYSYDQGTGNVTDTALNEIAAQTNAAVTNNSTQTPTISSVSTDAVALVGTASTITWSSGGIIGNVDILLSLDGGSTFPITIVSGTANDGSHSWTPTSAQITATGVIRVRSTNNNSYQGTRNVKIATTSGGIGGSTGLWFRLQELAVNDGLELSRP